MFGSDVGYYCQQVNNNPASSMMLQPPPPQQQQQQHRQHQQEQRSHPAVVPLAAIPTTSILPAVLCLVCNSRKPCPSVRSKSATICEACKKFFLRHRDLKVQQALQCATGRRDCDVTVTAKRPCSACRLAKCFNIGMRFEDYPMRTKASKRALSNNMLSPSQQRQLQQQRLQQQQYQETDQDELYPDYTKRSLSSSQSEQESSPLSPSTSSTSPSAAQQGAPGSAGDTTSSRSSGEQAAGGQADYDEIFDLTAPAAVSASSLSMSPSTSAVSRFVPIPNAPTFPTYAEEFLRKSLRALTELTAFETLPLRQPIGQIPDENMWWQLKMEHFQAAARSATAYVRQLPAFTNIPLSDRPVLFANALYPLLIADLALPSQPRGLSFLGMNERNRAAFLRYFSEFQMLSEDTNRITEVFSQWCPTMFEFAILAALLFYEPCFPGLQSTDMVRQVNDQLKTVLRVYLPQHCSNPKLVNWRLQQFEIAFGMLRRASIDHCLAIEMLSRRRPGFISMNELFYEVFMHTQRAVTLMTRQRQSSVDVDETTETDTTTTSQQQMALQPIQQQQQQLPYHSQEPLPAYQPTTTTETTCITASGTYSAAAFEPAFVEQLDGGNVTTSNNDAEYTPDSSLWQASNFSY